MTYLVDTDWIIDAIGGIAGALHLLEEHAVDGLAVSIVTLGELFEGAYGFHDPEQHLVGTRTFLSGYAVLGLDDPIMETFGRTRHTLRRQGNLIPDMDLMIAATALQHNLTVITRNVRHFSRIPGLTLHS